MSTRDKRFSKIGKDSRFIQLESQSNCTANVSGDDRFANLGKSISDMVREAQSSEGHSTDEVQSKDINKEYEEPIEEEYPVNSDDFEGEDVPCVDGEESTSLAIVNMDWDHIKAADLYVVLHSFLPATGKLQHVRIFMSEFGRERLAQEAVKGPALDSYIDKEREKIFAEYRKNMDSGAVEFKNTKQVPVTKLSSEYYNIKDYFDANADEAEAAAENAIRRYELDRMRYAFAIAKFNSVQTASNIYSQLNGVLFERSSCTLDLRVVMLEDEAQFLEGDKLIPVAEGGWMMDECFAFPQLYSAKDDFETKALQKTKPELTWDQTDPDRLKITTRKLSKEEAHDWANDPANQFIAMSDGDDDGDAGDHLRLLANNHKAGDSNSNDDSDGSSIGLDDPQHDKASKEDFFISFDSILTGNATSGRSVMAPTEQTPFQKYLEQRTKEKKANQQVKKIEQVSTVRARDHVDDSSFSLVVTRKEKLLQQKISDAKLSGDSHKLKRLNNDLQKLYAENPWLSSTAVTESDIIADDRFAAVLQNGREFHIDTSIQEYREGGDLSSVISAQRKIRR